MAIQFVERLAKHENAVGDGPAVSGEGEGVENDERIEIVGMIAATCCWNKLVNHDAGVRTHTRKRKYLHTHTCTCAWVHMYSQACWH